MLEVVDLTCERGERGLFSGLNFAAPGGTLLRYPGLVAGMLYYSLRDRL